MIVIGGPTSLPLASKVANELGVDAGKLEVRRFPDGEKYLRVLSDVKDQNVVVVQSIHHTPDELLFEYLLLVDTVKDLGAKRVTAFIPYFAYARQDERFKPGEALSFKTVSKLIESVGTDEIYTIDMHQHRVLKSSEVFGIPSHNLSAMPSLADHVQKLGKLEKPLVIGPDAEAEQWAKLAAERLHTDYDVFQKTRLGDAKVDVRPRKSNANGRDVLIVDDIISTGGTIVEAVKILKGQGASRVQVACTHPILAPGALEKIREAGVEDVIGTDTVPSPISVVSVAPLIAEQVKKNGD
ncbi:MAG TPA: ribose-phosphate diphosphokinase [Candidatus Acidoferrales bacterium]|nr:ribose-phosphate diphosphokinase [Candidatus Acidoferrales bacterium]